MFSKIGYSLSQAFKQMNKSKGTNFTSMLAITAMMLILGLFFIAFVNVDLFANVIKQDYNVVEIYLTEGDSVQQIDTLTESYEDMDGVQSVEFRSKADALKIMKTRWGDNGYLLDNLETNPLPDSLVITVENKNTADQISEEAKDVEGVEDVKYYQETIDKLAKVTNFIQISSLIIMIFLIVVSVIIVANTVKLTVFNREKEIGVMKYIGATDWFVRAPFLIEGIFIGAISAAVATGLTYVTYKKIIDIVGTDIMRVLSVPVVPANYLIFNLMFIFLALGVGIGSTGSIISMRRFLDK